MILVTLCTITRANHLRRARKATVKAGGFNGEDCNGG